MMNHLKFYKLRARDPSKSKLGNLLQDFDEERNKKKEEEQFLNISDIMISWLAERYYPVVNVNHDYKTARITTDCYECPECPQRNIPVNILTLSNLGVQHITDITWVQCPGSINIPLPPDIYFVMVNLQQFGKYRLRKLSHFVAYVTASFMILYCHDDEQFVTHLLGNRLCLKSK